MRVSIDQNLLLCIRSARPSPAAVQRSLDELGLAAAGAGHEIEDVTEFPLLGAYTCNLGLTKSMNLGAALAGMRFAASTIRRSNGFPSKSAAARTRAASTGSRISASTATRGRSMARRFRTTRCCWAAAMTSRG